MRILRHSYLWTLVCICAIAGCAQSAPGEASLSYALPNSEIVRLPTSSNGIDYELYIHIPPACEDQEGGCPVIYLLDAEYSFALSAQIVTHLADRDRIPPLISIAIGYPDKSQYRRFRSRDYTPYFHATGGYGEEMQKQSGGGPAFLEVIEKEIIPYIETHYHASSSHRTLVGHSYGGLCATYAWITSPETFENYVIVSPSRWYADGRPLSDAIEACAHSGFSGESDIVMTVGQYEEQPENGRAMVSDLQKLQSILDNCSMRSVATYLRVFEDETHASTFPAALSTSLRKHFQ